MYCPYHDHYPKEARFEEVQLCEACQERLHLQQIAEETEHIYD